MTPLETQAVFPGPEIQPSPMDDVWVALDLETTGLDPESDEIIEVGAVKFQGEDVLDTFRSYVNPDRSLSSFITGYTGISQRDVDGAPPFSSIASELSGFIGAAPVVGHNIPFDLSFLAAKGLRPPGPVCDTWDMAYVLMPGQREYGLSRVAAALGVPHPEPHSALGDAEAVHGVFLKLVGLASKLDLLTLAEMERMASRSSWVLSYFLRRLELSMAAAGTSEPSGVGAMGFDVGAVRKRLRHSPALRPNRTPNGVDPEEVAGLLEAGGPLSSSMDGFELREEQVTMTKAVAEAISDGKRLIVEAGTGVGKSLAYLLPAALYAIRNNKRVVISTNTINLQEQLLGKDVPVAAKAVSTVEPGEFRYSLLKGRANYLCLNRWAHMRSSPSLTDDEARALSKVLVWLRDSSTGDRAEINLSGRGPRSPWDRMSAQGARDCGGVQGACFLRASRDRAAAAHLVIVNHALLLTDLVVGGTLIPNYDVLIVDEAQHLEDEATKQLGFEVGRRTFDDHFEDIGGDRGLLGRAVAALRGSQAAQSRRETVETAAAGIAGMVPSIRDSAARLFGVLGGFIDSDGGQDAQLRVTQSTRSQPDWSSVETQWENVDVGLARLRSELEGLGTALEGLEDAQVLDYDSLLMELDGLRQATSDLRGRLREFVPEPKDDGIYWLSRSPNTDDIVLHSAPLDVGEQLEKLLYSQKSSIVLTGATLSVGGSFDHITERTGFSDSDRLLLGSPFDYPKAAMLCVPQDIAEPGIWEHQSAVDEAVVNAVEAAGGRTMALFTSYSSLNSTSRAVRGRLQSGGFNVLAQGTDGTPHQVLRTFMEEPKSVLLGTSSFWEGVDLAGDALQVLLVARLPFSVPTDPVFEARSELYEDPFYEYAVPQAVLRLRQGFGRLIRSKTDRGVVVILDRRITSRRYGQVFRDSLPPVTLKRCRLDGIGSEIQRWLEI